MNPKKSTLGRSENAQIGSFETNSKTEISSVRTFVLKIRNFEHYSNFSYGKDTYREKYAKGIFRNNIKNILT